MPEKKYLEDIFMENRNGKRLILGVIGLVVLVAVFAAVYILTRPDTSVGAKTITVTVVVPGRENKSFTIHTDEDYLRGALEQEKLISGSEGQYGLYVETVDGAKADSAKQEWWCFTKGGENLLTGVDTTPIQNGDSFEITLSNY
jgi:hypothetical protein